MISELIGKYSKETSGNINKCCNDRKPDQENSKRRVKGPDGVQSYWFDSIKAIRPIPTALLNETLQSGNTSKWLKSEKKLLDSCS